MKKLLYLFLTVMVVNFSACNDELDDLWQDPNKHTPNAEQLISGLFTQMQQSKFFTLDYGEWYWLLNYRNSFIHQAQIVTFMPYNEDWCEYHSAIDFGGDVSKYMTTANNSHTNRFEHFYTYLANYGLIKDELKSLSGAEYDDNIIYGRLSTIIKDIIGLQTVDLFNKIPFTEAFKGTEGIFFPKYDDPEEIYKSVIEEYKTIAAELPGLLDKMSPTAKTMFQTQDIFFKGDINKWVQYINVMRLKACLRISGVVADYVKPHIAEVLQNLPAEDFIFDHPKKNIVAVSTGHNDAGTIHRSWFENNYMLAIPDHLMLSMNRGDSLYDVNVDDPRLPVLVCGHAIDSTFDKIEYYGVSMNWQRNWYLRSLPDDAPGVRKPRAYSVNGANMKTYIRNQEWNFYNSATFTFNQIPMYLMSLAEMDLMLAEIELKGLASTGKSAADHIKNSVVNSTDFWYAVNARPDNIDQTLEPKVNEVLHPTKPSSTVINNYAAVIQAEYNTAAGTEDKMEIIIKQKYIHLNILQAYECFAELRRTRHPKLEPITSGITGTVITNAKSKLERFIYPSSELSSNFEEYSKVSAEDNWTSHIFWVPQDKRSENYYLPTQLKVSLP